MNHRYLPVFRACVLSWSLSLGARGDELDEALAVISRVGPNGAGAADARAARDRVAREGLDALPRLLRAMNSPNVVAANYYRSAFEELVARELSSPNSADKLPRSSIEAFVLDANHRGRARRLALALLGSDFRDRQLVELVGWLDDPEFRGDAVQHLIGQGDQRKKADDTAGARAAFQLAFQHARDSDQVLQAVARLKSVGVDVDPARHLGFVTRWYFCGPFDAPEMTGFAKAFPPEERLDLKAEYTGRDGLKLGWRAHATRDPLGQFNLIQDLAAVKEAVGYAYCEIDSAAQQEVQLRCSADDNLSVWINRRKVLAREQWLNGTRLDRFITAVTLDAGMNRVLVKICQGPQHVDPAVSNNWSFQLRFCGVAGEGAKFQMVRPTLDEAGVQP